MLNICASSTGEQAAARPVITSSLSLLGLVRQLATVERRWFREQAGGQLLEPMYGPFQAQADFEDTDPSEAASGPRAAPRGVASR
ncbi:MAG: DUF664 domain-containing protein [Acidimicrobiales bacterium]